MIISYERIFKKSIKPCLFKMNPICIYWDHQVMMKVLECSVGVVIVTMLLYGESKPDTLC